MLRAALGDEPDLSAEARPYSARKFAREHLHFFDGLDVLCAEHRPGGARPCGNGSVDRDEIFVVACAVDAESCRWHAVGSKVPIVPPRNLA